MQGRARLHGRRCLPEACIRLHGLPGHHGLRGSMLAQPADRCAGLQGLMVSDVWSSMRANRLQITARACKASWSLCLPQACRLPRGLPRLHSLNASPKPASTGQLDNNWSRGDRSVDWHLTLTAGGSTPPPLHHCRSIARAKNGAIMVRVTGDVRNCDIASLMVQAQTLPAPDGQLHRAARGREGSSRQSDARQLHTTGWTRSVRRTVCTATASTLLPLTHSTHRTALPLQPADSTSDRAAFGERVMMGSCRRLAA